MPAKDDIKLALENCADTSGNLRLRLSIGAEGARLLVDGEVEDTGQAYAVPGFLDCLLTAVGGVIDTVSGGGGTTEFTDLTDTPSSYTGQAGKVVAVKSTEDGLEFTTVASATSQVRVSAADTTPDYLFNKITVSSALAKAIQNGGLDETILISVNFGSTAGTVCEGNDPRLSDARTPVAHALGGPEHTADSLANLNTKITDATLDDIDDPRPADEIIETSGPTTLTVGSIADGEFLVRSGSSVIGASSTSTVDIREEIFTAAGGDESFVLGTSIAANPNFPAGLEVSVYAQGKRLKYVATPLTVDDYGVTGTNQIDCKALTVGDRVIIEYTVSVVRQREDVFTASGGDQSFVLSSNPAVNAQYPAGVEVSVYRQGQRLGYVATPLTAFDYGFTGPNQIDCKGLIAGDKIVVAYGV